MMKTRRKTDISVEIRQKELKKIVEIILTGESCSVVGIGSVGKSNLLRLLQQENIHHSYIGAKSKKYLFVYIDGNKKLENTDWGLFELMFHQLNLALTKSNAKESTLQLIDKLYLQATVSLSPSMKFLMLRYLDRVISLIIDDLGLCIVLLLDEFDALCQTISPNAFSILRAMRDDHKYKLMYVVATRTELTNLRTETMETEAFYEIITSNTITLLAYSEADAIGLLNRLRDRYSVELSQDAKNTIIRLSGGHPALIRAVFDVFRDQTNLKSSQIISNPRVFDECRRIWTGLSREEQAGLSYVANLKKQSVVPHEFQSILDRRGLLGGAWTTRSSIFSPIFEEFILKEKPVAGTEVLVDRSHHTVWVNGQKFSGLPPLEFRFIDYLEQHRGQVCSRDEITQFLYPDAIINKGEGISDNRVDSIVKRVRKKLEVNPDDPRHILTIRGIGFRLVDGNEHY